MNPFEILNIGQNATKSEIIQAVARAMREKKYSVKDLAAAQKLLFDPVERGIHNFLYFVDLSNLKKQIDLNQADSATHEENLSLDRLAIFDE